MVPKKVIFLGSKPIGYTCFAYLVSQKDVLNIEIIGLLTQARKEFGDGHDLTALAASNHIPVISSLAEMPECDLLYSVQYHQILKGADIAKAKQAAINLHMAPLPEYRGSNQFSYAIIDDKKEFGTTIHLMDTRIDHGDILFQKRFPIPEACWVKDLYDLTFDASVELFIETLSDIISRNYTPTPQQQLEEKYGTSLHYRAEAGSIKQIELGQDKPTIEKYIRATSMPGFEPPYCIINGEKVYFTRHNS
jgi:methionyl-tRNA formyltransferase